MKTISFFRKIKNFFVFLWVWDKSIDPPLAKWKVLLKPICWINNSHRPWHVYSNNADCDRCGASVSMTLGTIAQK